MKPQYRATETLSKKLDAQHPLFEHHIFLMEEILGLRETIDGFSQSIKLLAELLNSFDFLKQHIDDNIQQSILFLAKHIHLFPEKSSSKNKNNPRSGKYEKNQLLACWSQRIIVRDDLQRRTIKILLGYLFIYRLNNPACENDINASTSSSINVLCAKLRKLSTKSVVFEWPDLDVPELEIVEQIEKRSRAAIQNEFTLVRTGLTDLRKINNVRKLIGTPKKESAPTRLITRDATDDSDLPQQVSTHTTYSFKDNAQDEFDEPHIEVEVSEPEQFSNDFEFTYQERLARLASSQYRSEMDNQYLPLDWRFLNHFEIERVITTLKNYEFTHEKAIALLTIATSLNAKQLYQLYIAPEHPPKEHTSYITTKNNTWTSPFPKIPGKFLAREIHKEFLTPCASKITLPLPQILQDFLSSIGTGFLGQLLQYKSPNHLEHCLDEFLTDIKDTAKIRISRLKLRSLLFNLLNLKNNDPILSAFAINSDEYSPSVAMYYCSFPLVEIQQCYADIVAELGLPTIAEHTSEALTRYGSEAFWPPQQHCIVLEHVYRRINHSAMKSKCDSWQELAQYHNTFVCFTAWMMLCGTGHRQCESIRIDSENINQYWCVVDDKAKQYNNARLVRLCADLQSQMQHYRTHLSALAQYLRPYNAHLSKKVGMLASYPIQNIPSLPLFFLLSEQAPGEITNLGTRHIWKYLELPDALPRNVSRHWFVTGLRAAGIHCEWISDAAGHSSVGQMPFSSSSMFSPDTRSDLWDVGVSNWLNTLGFKPTSGLAIQLNKRIPSLSIAEFTEVCQLSKPVSSSPKASITEIIELAHQRLSEALLSFQEADIDDLLSSLSSQHHWCEEEKAEARLRLDSLMTDDNTINESQVATEQKVTKKLTPENSPIESDHLLNVQRAIFLREQFTKSLPKTLANLPSQQLYALASISLALNSLILNEKERTSLLQNLNNAVHVYSSFHWIEWEFDNRTLRRFADPISMLIIIHLKEKPYPGHKILTKNINNVLDNLIDESMLFAGKKGTWSNIPLLKQCMQAWAYQQLPGTLAAVTCGKLRVACLPAQNMLRILTGEFIKDENVKDENQGTSYPSTIIQKQTLTAAEVANEFSRLTAIVDRLKKLPESDKQVNTACPYRKELIASTERLKQEWRDANASSLLQAFANYAIFNFKRKTKGRYLSHNTLSDYLNTTAKPLLYLSHELDWFTLSSEELEEIYAEALLFSSDNDGSRKRRASRLRYFHDYCVEKYQQAALDLAAVDPAYEYSRFKAGIRASFITYQEYCTSKDIIATENSLSTLQKENLTLLLILIFRFSLRVAEAIGLDTSDIEFESERCLIYVRKNRINRPKTNAGFRQVVATLTSEEYTLLSSRVTQLKTRYDGSIAAVFSRQDKPWQLVSRSMLTQQLMMLLKQITGTSLTNLHSSRHTKVCSEINEVMLLGGPYSSKDNWTLDRQYSLQQQLLGNKVPTKRLSYAIANQLGHASFQTTFESYTHTFDLLIANHLHSFQIETKTSVLARLAGLEIDTVRQIRYRAKTQQAFEHKLIKAAYLQRNDKVKRYTTFDPYALRYLFEQNDNSDITINTLDAIVSSIANGADADTTALNFGIEIDKAELLKSKLSELILDCQLPPTLLSKRLFSLTQNKKERSQRLLSILNENEESTYKLANIWISCYHAKISGLLIAEQNQYDEFVAIVESIEGLNICFKASSTAELPATDNLSFQSHRYRSKVVLNHRRIDTPQIFISTNNHDADKPRSMHSFHKAMMLFSLKATISRS